MNSAIHSAPPLVSVIIPCYNQAHFLCEAIESVLLQTYPHIEVVVVDDGSHDNTSAVALHFPNVRLVRQENLGPAEARNTGIRESIGDFLLFLDADDLLVPDGIEVGLGAFKAHPDCAFVAGHHRRIAVDREVLEIPNLPCRGSDPYAGFLKMNFVGTLAAVLWRREILENVGGFSRFCEPCEDYHLYLRVAREFPFICHHRLVADYRRYGGSLSDDPARMLRMSLEVLKTQRDFVRANPEVRRAYHQGRSFRIETYGRKLQEEIAERLINHQWSDAFRGLAALSVYAPKAACALIVRRLPLAH